jgi:hypothetical protein
MSKVSFNSASCAHKTVASFLRGIPAKKAEQVFLKPKL